MNENVVILNPRTCGIYKNGHPRFKTDPTTGSRTKEIDNELLDAVEAYLDGKESPGQAGVDLAGILNRRVLVPTYYDDRYNVAIRDVLESLKVDGVTIGDLLSSGVLKMSGGHGSPSNDQRQGHIPYVKVSDIRGLRINVNPTNLVSDVIAHRMWHGPDSGLKAWDLITPNRASSNIGEFAILLPGEERIVLTKEVFIFSVLPGETVWDQFYLLWALSLGAVRDQWRRIALMQTNREDCGDRYREIILPNPPNRKWAEERSAAFRDYFATLAAARETFVGRVSADGLEYVANVRAVASIDAAVEIQDDLEEDNGPAEIHGE